MFYTYDQNNSGGEFHDPAMYVIIEAESATQADAIAESHGIYFDGLDRDIDCPCCGDRWYSAYEHDGFDVPSVYGVPVWESQCYYGREDYDVPCVQIIFLDGTVISGSEPQAFRIAWATHGTSTFTA